MDYICDYCGKIFKVTESKVIKVKNGEKKGLYCSSQCAKDVQKPKWDDIVCLFESKGYKLISTEYINAKTKLDYICNAHVDKGIQSITYGNLKNRFGCKYCGRDRTTEVRKISFDEAKEVFLNHDMILLDQPYYNSHTPLKYICKHHKDKGIQQMALTNAYKQYCPFCSIKKGEQKILSFLQLNNIEYEFQKSYDGLIGVKGGKLSYDFYLPKFNYLIEYQGEQHEHPVEYFGGEKQFEIQQEHDKRKRMYANHYNINLLEVWYFDYNNIDEILEKTILNTA